MIVVPTPGGLLLTDQFFCGAARSRRTARCVQFAVLLLVAAGAIGRAVQRAAQLLVGERAVAHVAAAAAARVVARTADRLLVAGGRTGRLLVAGGG